MTSTAQGHLVTVRLTYLGTTPYKWRGECTCGWWCVSWQWVADDRPGGALPMALDHIHRTTTPDEES